ncbi:oligosaccharide flippase family protein [Aurantibacter crassamenti]|uniref:lipopolysaccharide biosynthesis protein n=1 Tax=Aurantibacter crassamenti TaxID=1837375 RepID=UPI00193A6FDB|nr:oligosaccharide flippase family protein [Aurantibacter crassamenti]MBM1105819.1 oligosaccharide flippase family protein [Aurantibacter crassamenti]
MFDPLKNRFISPLSNFIRDKMGGGHERSVKAKKNIAGSLIIKVVSIAISLIVVPLTLNYVNPSRYGIWLTLSSIVAWFSFFDIGITHGLRNKFAEAKAKGDHDSAQIYVSTTYGILAIVFCSVWLIFLLVNPFLDWSSILKLSPEYAADVSKLALIVFTYFCLQFVLQTITTVITADQEPAQASLINVIGQIITLIVIVILVKTTEGSLVKLGLALCASPLIALIGANFFFFKGKYKAYRPKISKIKFTHAKGLFNLGVIFFVIQIAGLVQYESANIIISRSFGPSEVTSYNIVYKYFNILSMGFMIFLAPFWSASTEAFMKKEIDWIKNSMKKYNYLNIAFLGGGIVMLLASETIYTLWLGKDVVDINFTLSFWGFAFFMVSLFGSKYVSFLNGISALRLQFWASIFSPVLYLILAYLMIDYFNMGVHAMFIAAILANFNGFILAPLQYHMIINKKKQGIWIR